MTYNNERHKQLLKRSLDLRNQKKTLFIEDPKEFLELNEYDAAVDEHVYRAHYDEFVQTIKNLLTNSINFDGFEDAFLVLYTKARKESELFQTDLEQIENFQPQTQPYKFANIMHAFYRQFEEMEDGYVSEQEAIEYIKETCLKYGIFKDVIDLWT